MTEASPGQSAVVYRQPRLEEVERLAALGSNLFVDTFGHLYSPENLRSFLDRVHSPAGVLSDLQSGSVYWIAEVDNEWIGYCKFGSVHVPIEETREKGVELKQLYVTRPYHGKQVASHMMKLFNNWARQQQAEVAFISCWSENARALAFYRRYGFEVVGRYHFMVGDHADEEFILKRAIPLIGFS